MLTEDDVDYADEFAYFFMVDYLERTPEYIDVVEFVTDTAAEDLDPAIADEFLDRVYASVIDHLNRVVRSFGND